MGDQRASSLVGHRIGNFQLTGLLGIGAMGEVYRARDSRLGREVAIKILPDAFSEDPERLARFEREAQILASLSHPHIAAIHGIEDQPSSVSGAGPRVRALVLELVEGETLADLLLRNSAEGKRGLPVAEAVTIARQLADALDAAHERGIVHRDLKPANIKVRPDGVVKVLDFGLARGGLGAAVPAGGPAAVTATLEGAIVGSPAYMSPEQARGLPIDKRADIWAFGCVVYELITGCIAFRGNSITETLVQICEREPDWSRLPADTPPNIRRLLERCLAKDRRRRLRDIADAEFDGAAAGGSPEGGVPLLQPRFLRLTDSVGMNEWPAISPDGKMVAFVAPVDGRQHIWVQLLAGGTPLRITREAIDHEQPRWAPDSSTLIYFTPPSRAGDEGTIWEVSALGGQPRPVMSALYAGDISHSGDRIAIFQNRAGRAALVVVARDGSRSEPLAFAPVSHGYRSVRWSPDDQWIGFEAATLSQFDERLYVLPAAGGEPRPIARAGSIRGFAWAPDNSGLYYSSSRGSTVPYPRTHNLRRVALDGTMDRQITVGDDSHVQPDVHRSGRLVVCRLRSQTDIWKFQVAGDARENTRAAIRVTRQTGQVQTPCVSPDGRGIVYLSDRGGHGNLWVAATDGSPGRQITFERDPAVSIGAPIWSPAGDQIAFVVAREGASEIWLIQPDGRGLRRLVDQGLGACWSRDGRWLYFEPIGETGQPSGINKVPVTGGTATVIREEGLPHGIAVGDGTLYFAMNISAHSGVWDWQICRATPEDGPAEPLARVSGLNLPVSYHFVQPNLSPDGRWLALPLVAGCTTDVWAIATSDGSLRRITEFGDRPTIIARQVSWSPDSEYLFAAVADVNADIVLLEGLI